MTLNSKRQQTVFVDLSFSEFQERIANIDTSEYIQEGFCVSLIVFDDIHWENGACGRSKDKEEHENIDLSSFLTILIWKTVPAVAITTHTHINGFTN